MRQIMMNKLLRAISVAVCAAMTMGFMAADLALASTESPPLQMVTEEWGKGKGPHEEGRFLGEPEGLAVNDTTGDVYEADGPEGRRVQVYDAEGAFKESWGWGVGDEKEEYERCGPSGEPSHPECIGRGEGQGLAGEGNGQFKGPRGIAVDQATGEVLVEDDARSHGVVQVFTAGGVLVEAFGVKGATAEDEIQEPGPSGQRIAISKTGAVYLLDKGEKFGPRVMEFHRVEGVYKYARTLCQKAEAAKQATELAIDEAGNLYVAHETKIYKISKELSKESCSKPLWEMKATKTSVGGMSVDWATGNVYFYNRSDKMLHELNGETGKETQAFVGGAKQVEGRNSAVNPGAGISSRNGPDVYEDAIERVGIPSEGFIYAGLFITGHHPPKVTSIGAEEVGSSVAALRAEIDPNGLPTQYVFRYGPAPCASSPCKESSGVLPLTSGVQEASAALQGLQPETRYYFDVVAINSEGTVTSAEESLRTFAASAGSSDGRVFEMVSPPNKFGGEVFPLDSFYGSCSACEPGENNLDMPREATPSGASVVYEGYPFAASGGAVDENEYLATRTSDGWQSRVLSPPGLAHENGGFRALSSDFGVGVLAQREPVLNPNAPAGYDDLYRWEASGVVTPLVTSRPEFRTPTGEQEFRISYAGASSDFDHIVFEANDALTGETADAPAAKDGGPAQSNLYEWVAGKLQLVNVLPGNKATVTGVVLGSGTELGETESAPATEHAVSTSGARIFWSEVASGQVYLRENGETTIKMPDAGKFVMAAPDGSKVLLNDGHVYDVETQSLVDLTAGAGGFLGTLGASEDLSIVYFVDTAVLTGGEVNGFGASAQAGGDNLYVYDAHARTTKYIATLVASDNRTGLAELSGVWQPSPSDRVAQVTQDGGYAAFMSTAKLTGYDNEGLGGGCGAGGCSEIFEYALGAGELVCASCNPTELPPTGAAHLPLIKPLTSIFPQPRYLMDDGRLYFDSRDRLANEDTEPGVENVYEFERAGQGSCTQSKCIVLISSGHSEESLDASFFSASADGRDVFFTTRARLALEDRDELVDLYDAREGGGFVSVPEGTPCSGEACRGPAPAPPLLSSPASATFSGLGNVVPTKANSLPAPGRKKCRKGRVRKHGKCVKRRLSHGKRR